jgi:hypothetical protein
MSGIMNLRPAEPAWWPGIQLFASSRKSAALRGGVLVYAAQAIPPIDAEIAEKGHLWMETI